MYCPGWTLTYFEIWTSEGNFHLSEMKIHLPKLFLPDANLQDFMFLQLFWHRRGFKFYLCCGTSGVGSSVVRQLLLVVQGSQSDPCCHTHTISCIYDCYYLHLQTIDAVKPVAYTV